MSRDSQGKRTGGQEEMTKIAILGYGTVGSGVYEVLKKMSSLAGWGMRFMSSTCLI